MLLYRQENFCVLIMLSFFVPITLTECPRLCECKWKSGKESVICINANLTVVPEKLESGTQILDLTGNNLSSIRNEEFSKAGLLNLQKIYLARCKLKLLDKLAFNNLINLVDLDLSFNFLSSIPSHALESIPELRELKLSGNPIYKISSDSFANTPQLIRLEMSNCKISNIESGAFHGLEKSLEWLKLDRNKLSDVEPASFTIFQNLHGLELTGNPWNCSCALRPLREWMLTQNVPFDIPPVCSFPKRLFQRSWDKLDLDEFACVPEIFAYESKTKGVEGKNVTITCQIDGIPKPSVKWLLKNKVIANLTGPTFNGKKMYLMHITNSSSDLTIFSADLQDAGTYVCTAENKAGRAEASVTLAVSKPSEIENLTKEVLLISVFAAMLLTVSACVLAVYFCKNQKKSNQLQIWKTRSECGREDNYEKIELNQKSVGSKMNGGIKNREDTSSLTTSSRKNGDYRVVPGGESEHDEEDESTLEVATPSTSASRRLAIEPKKDSPKDPISNLFRNEDGQNLRDNIRRTHSSTFGTYRVSPTSTISPSNPFYTSLRFCQTTTTDIPTSSLTNVDHVNSRNPNAGSSYKTISTSYQPDQNSFMTSVVGNSNNKIPDIINLYGTNTNKSVNSRTQSENGSYLNINELFCTLPRKKDLAKYKSNDSQAPLLPDSRYNSSGGESVGSLVNNSNRRMSIESQRQTIANLNYRVNKLSGSFLNLAKEDSSTPLLDINSLENRVLYKGYSKTSKPPNPYDYHAAQLERFLEEYRILQKQLTEMKETCDSIVQSKLAGKDSGGTSNEICDTPNSTKSLKETVERSNNYDSELTKYLLMKSPSSRNMSSEILSDS